MPDQPGRVSPPMTTPAPSAALRQAGAGITTASTTAVSSRWGLVSLTKTAPRGVWYARKHCYPCYDDVSVYSVSVL